MIVLEAFQWWEVIIWSCTKEKFGLGKLPRQKAVADCNGQMS